LDGINFNIVGATAPKKELRKKPLRLDRLNFKIAGATR
jgi:hypothetical protein